MANERFLKERKALFIKGKFRDKEELIKVAKSQAAATLGIKGKIVVVHIDDYDPDLEGQSVVFEFGSEYTSPGSGRRELRK